MPAQCAGVLNNTQVAASIVVAASAGALVDAFGGGSTVMHYWHAAVESAILLHNVDVHLNRVELYMLIVQPS
jgi:hypothetical protein